MFDYEDDGFREDYQDKFDCWFEEDDLLTNFFSNQLPLYERAIKEFGDDTLYISDKAYHSNGFKMEGVYSLRTTVHKDRSDFWNLFDSLRDSLDIS